MTVCVHYSSIFLFSILMYDIEHSPSIFLFSILMYDIEHSPSIFLFTILMYDIEHSPSIFLFTILMYDNEHFPSIFLYTILMYDIQNTNHSNVWPSEHKPWIYNGKKTKLLNDHLFHKISVQCAIPIHCDASVHISLSHCRLNSQYHQSPHFCVACKKNSSKMQVHEKF